MDGRIFNIQKFSTHDGPGIRTTVFFKGCNLRCAWCHNPESYLSDIQLEYFQEQCARCGMCEAVCPKHIGPKQRQENDLEQCLLCKKCEDACLNGAIKVSGRDISAGELLKAVLQDRKYYENSGGGVTVSGGEPMLQWKFLKEFLPLVKAEGIHVALDTAGNIPAEAYREVLPYVDLILLDLKIMDEALHKKYTGVSNARILQNAKGWLEEGRRLHIRVPVIAGINDTRENMEALAGFLDGYEGAEEIRLLPYHTMGLEKAKGLGIAMETFKAPTEETMAQLQEILGKRCVR